MLTCHGVTIPQTLEEMVSPQSTALIVYDMQAGITTQIKNGAEITTQYRMAMAWQQTNSPEEIRPLFLRDSPAFHIVPELQPLPSEAIFDKLAMSAFEGTPLEMALRDCGVRNFIIAGIALEIGIDPTCRQGADLGLCPILVRDACGTGNAVAAQHSLASLEHMGDTTITDVKTICALLESPGMQTHRS